MKYTIGRDIPVFNIKPVWISSKKHSVRRDMPVPFGPLPAQAPSAACTTARSGLPPVPSSWFLFPTGEK